jgi:hypothetical protein
MRSPHLNELMIVNPGSPGNEDVLESGRFFFGEDGTLYQMLGQMDEDLYPGSDVFFLGEDGVLYEMI